MIAFLLIYITAYITLLLCCQANRILSLFTSLSVYLHSWANLRLMTGHMFIAQIHGNESLGKFDPIVFSSVVEHIGRGEREMDCENVRVEFRFEGLNDLFPILMGS
jgi:hypothetical protein